MNGKCVDLGKMQAFLDGELPPDASAPVSGHIADCDACAAAFAAAEEENSVLFAALDRELNSLVPTQRLWTRINESICVEDRRISLAGRLSSALSFLFKSPTFSTAAAALVIASVFIAVATLRNGEQIPSFLPPSVDVAVAPEKSLAPSASDSLSVSASLASGLRPAVKLARLNAKRRDNPMTAVKYVSQREVSPLPAAAASAAFLPGEESYVKTIADLKQAVDIKKDDVLTPSSRVSYERDMAVVNDSIKRMQSVVRANPKNQAARQVLYSAYQDKIDLLNSVARREELMASLR